MDRLKKHKILFLYLSLIVITFCITSCKKSPGTEMGNIQLIGISEDSTTKSEPKESDKITTIETIISNKEKNNSVVEEITTTVRTTIVVEIKGEVIKPGVYELEEGARLNDLITASGGLTVNGNTDYLNKASVLLDSQSILIPSKGITIEEYEKLVKEVNNSINGVTHNEQKEKNDVSLNKNTTKNNVKDTNMGNKDSIDNKDNSISNKDMNENKEKSSLINLNSASQSELETIPGVGPVTAKNIISYRESSGGFKNIEELKNVDRIGDKTFQKLKPFVTVD